MLALEEEVNAGKVSTVKNMLIDGTADVLIIPYFHMLWSAHLWPCDDETTATLTLNQRESFRRIPGFVCPSQRKADLHPFVVALRESPYIDVVDTDLFATIRLRPKFAGSANRSALMTALLGNIPYPITLDSGLKYSEFILGEGWHDLETYHVWSQAFAILTLPIPKNCDARACFAIVKFNVFGASPLKPITVIFNSADGTMRWNEKVISTSSDVNKIAVPLSGATVSRKISISIPDATSPKALTGSPDGRILGIGLIHIDLVLK